jgi:hypothetical protein
VQLAICEHPDLIDGHSDNQGSAQHRGKAYEVATRIPRKALQFRYDALAHPQHRVMLD